MTTDEIKAVQQHLETHEKNKYIHRCNQCIYFKKHDIIEYKPSTKEWEANWDTIIEMTKN